MTKKQNKRYAKKRALRTSNASREPMSACRRNWGQGAGSYSK